MLPNPKSLRFCRVGQRVHYFLEGIDNILKFPNPTKLSSLKSEEQAEMFVDGHWDIYRLFFHLPSVKFPAHIYITTKHIQGREEPNPQRLELQSHRPNPPKLSIE